MTNREIETPVKGKRLIQREPIDATSWAFMKLLRQHDETRKIYPEDPFVEVYTVRENVYALFSISADGMGDPWSYLIVGEEKAMLIDTGFGVGDLKSLVERLSQGKEVTVVNTHCHFDHAYGNCQFDTVYCHELEAETLAQKEADPHIWDYLFDENGLGIWLDITKEDIIPYRRYRIVPCSDGTVFRLGEGHEVELIWTAGHSAGHAMFLDRKNRLLFAGDDIISMRVGMGRNSQYTTIQCYRDQMKKLLSKTSEFDYIFPGHFIFNIENSVVESYVQACDAILKDPMDYDLKTEKNGKPQYQKFVKGMGTLAYTDSNIYQKEAEA